MDGPLVRSLSERVRADGRKVVYVGTPGPDILDLREWNTWIDFAIASEKKPKFLRELKSNARQHGWEGRYVSTTLQVGPLISQRTEEAEEIFGRAPDWPTVVNYDVYAHPVRGNLQKFDRRDGLWADLRSFLEAATDEVPEILLLLTANVRGKSAFLDVALRAILGETRGYGIEISEDEVAEFLRSSMAKKTQVCLPYWLSRGGATVEGFGIEVLDSMTYPGTGGRAMFHLALRIRSHTSAAAMPEIPLIQLLNFGHRVVQQSAGKFLAQVETAPVVGVSAADHQ